MFWNEDDTHDNRYDSKVFRGIETSEFELCRDVTFAADSRKCTNFEAGESYIMYTNDNEKVYFVSMTYTLEWKDIAGKIDGVGAGVGAGVVVVVGCNLGFRTTSKITVPI